MQVGFCLPSGHLIDMNACSNDPIFSVILLCCCMTGRIMREDVENKYSPGNAPP